MHGLFTMMVTGGSRCDLLQSCCQAPPYCGLSSNENLEVSQRSKEWHTSVFRKENLRITGLVRTRISCRNLPTCKYQSCILCVNGSCTSVTGSESGVSLSRVVVSTNLIRRRGICNQVTVKRRWIRCYANGVSREDDKNGGGSRGHGGKQSGPIESTSSWTNSVSLDSGEGSEPKNFLLTNPPYGGGLEVGISNSEYQKIQDLRFSGDIWENDSGPQVLDLQRTLYWFGYLPNRTALTAYFGPETKKALQQFQIAHGVPATGAWGSSSRQALWKLLSEDRSSFSEGSIVHDDFQLPDSTSVDEVNAGGADVRIRVSELMNSMGGHSQEFMSTLSSALHWGHLPAKIPKSAAIFGLFLGVLVALFGLGYSVVGLFHGQRGQPVRRRLLRAHWRDDLIGKTSTKPKRHLNVFLGLDLPPVGEGNFKYKLRSKSNPSSTNGVGRTDRLILYEGQVLTGDETLGHAHRFVTDPTSRRGSGRTSQVPPKAKTSSFSLQESTDKTMQKSASNERLPALREKISQDSQIPFNGLTNARNRDSKAFKMGGNRWRDEDEDFKDRVEELRKAVQAAEKNRQAAMRALAEERQRSLELQVKISRQKETAAALEEEVRVLKESHDALLASLRKKYSSSVAARAAAALLYQNWDTEYEEGSPQTLSN
ncbi:uncharacterized protein [Physcomitrium patens]|uniref:Peptidoglycan binding-like domain-containing protein n=1 Tax=Physcomitrium patens TaxID=3218 RepID=A0A7I4AIX1_PHYPA|nr:uncharacterized protein LOC112289409 isoform X2 [Physcomitrium patens]|eukprot:XP_024390361.1 uncharacterized protein LOC112289409 isoform X2 [Physcomitrella patens]